jgi:acyl dehydratase
MTERYFEDFAVGQVFKPTGRVRIEKEDIIAFAQKYDPQPFHLDEEAARHSMFGRLVASGWHTAAVTMSLIARSEDRAAGADLASKACAGRSRFSRATSYASKAKYWRCGRRGRGQTADF